MSRPEVGESVVVSGRATNYLHAGSGAPVILIHGSGPGVSAYANWRLTVPALAEQFEVDECVSINREYAGYSSFLALRPKTSTTIAG